MSDIMNGLLGRLKELSGECKPHIVVDLLREQGKHLEADYIEGMADQIRLLKEQNRNQQKVIARFVKPKSRKGRKKK